MEFTPEQKCAIEKKGSNILVAAAAGSGKTAVLVERIIEKILNDNVDIDKLLVVTFTNAAASEMREKILDAIYGKLNENPDNILLQRQINLLGKSNICTIDSFCLDVIKNNFFEIDISPNFRIISQEENILLKQEVLEELFEKKYESEDKEFLKLIDVYTNYKSDDDLKNIVLKLYEFSQSAPFPDEWLDEKIEMFDPKKKDDADFGKTVWGKIIIKEINEELTDAKNNFRSIQNKLMMYPELEKYVSIINNDIEKLRNLKNALEISWDEGFKFFREEFGFERWSADKKITIALKDEAKDLRAAVTSKLKKSLEKKLLYNSEDAYKDIFEMYEILFSLKNLIFDFKNDFMSKKKEKNVIDFGDIEHYALKVLVSKDEDGNLVQTEVAKRYAEKFEEIAIDEYQDSNHVQEIILNSVSKRK